MDLLLEAGGDRVAVYGLTSEAGYPIYVHSKVCVIDDVWASVGSDNFNRRSWSSDSEVACAVQDTRVSQRDAGQAPRDSSALRVRRELVAEHLGIEPDQVPDDPDEVWDLMAAAATALDEWYAAGRGPRGRRHLPRPKGLRKGTSVVVASSLRRVVGRSRVELLPGRLRRLSPPELSRTQLLWAPRLYDLFDPDGTVLRDDEI